MLYYGLVLLASTKILLVCLLDGINSLDTSLAKTSESHNCESVLQTNTHSRGKISSSSSSFPLGPVGAACILLSGA